MRKLFLILFVSTALGGVFTSCGGDDEPTAPDLSYKTIANLKGDYTGTCKISLDIETGKQKTYNTDLYIDAGGSNMLLLYKTTEFGILTNDRGKMTNFNFTSELKTTVDFNMAGFLLSEYTAEANSIPVYVKDWFQTDKTTVDKVVIDFTNPKVAVKGTYSIESQKIQFIYTGKFKIFTTFEGKQNENNYEIYYQYDVVAK